MLDTLPDVSPDTSPLRSLLLSLARLLAEARGLLPERLSPQVQQGTLKASPDLLGEALAPLAWLAGPVEPALSGAVLAALPKCLGDCDPSSKDAICLLGDLYTSLLTERHKQGSYYTPPALAGTVARETLGPLLASPSVQALRILDPAMGSGHFLIAAGCLLAEQIAARAPMLSQAEARWQAIGCLYGLDCDPLAVELAGIGLWLWAALLGTSPADLAQRLICGDALLDDAPWPSPSGRFDAVIGNPPFASVFTQDPQHKQALRARYETARGSFDLAVPFVERAIQLCRPGGRCGLVLPNKILSASYAQTLRTWLVERVTVEAIIDWSAARPFEADVYPVACIFRCEAPESAETLAVYRGDGDGMTRLRSTSQAALQDTPGGAWGIVLGPEWETLCPCWVDSIPLGEAATLVAGMTVAEAYALREQVIDLPPGAFPSGAVRLVTSGLIRRYRDLWGLKVAHYLKRRYRRPAIMAQALPSKRYGQALGEKIVIAGLGLRPHAFLDRGLTQASVTTTIITDAHWPLGALCALLNSELAARLFRALFGGLALSGGYLRFGKRELGLLPLPKVSADDPRIARLDALSLRIAKADASEAPALDAEIEVLVRSLYAIELGESP